MLTIKFKQVLSLLEVLKKVEKEHKFHIDTYGYEKYIYYPEFRFKCREEVKFPNLLFIDEIEHVISYGFSIEDGQYNESVNLITGQQGTNIEIESVTSEPFNHYIDYNFIIKGEPEYIDDISGSNPFVAELTITGCLNTSPFWKQSLYLSYLFYKENNILTSFMHLFITFEGLIRLESSNNREGLHMVYKNYTNQTLPDYLDAYRKIRNQVMHGNENIAFQLTSDDLEILIDTILSLKLNKTSVSISENTLAINQGVLLS